MAELSDHELLDALGVSAEPEKKISRSPREERIIAGFEEIQRFVEEQGHVPRHGDEHDIFEQLYAVRLDRLRGLEECRNLLKTLDHQSILSGEGTALSDELDDKALLSELGVADETSDLTELRHVRSATEKRIADEIADRQKCEDFDVFKPVFDQVQKELATGLRETREFVKDAGFSKADIKKGQFFILGGQTVYVAEVGKTIKAPNGEEDARLRVVYSNGTESNLLRRSLQRALYKDGAGRRISDPTAGPLFAGETDDGDEASGTIYVLRSKSQHPVVAENRDVLHKIGVTSGKVERRISNAKTDPTFLMAEVEVVATYELFNINRAKLENLIHRIFDAARLDIEIKDRFGKPVVPREWFLVPLFVINEAVEKIKNGTISDNIYDPQNACLRKVG
jgi:Meiotically up-regulated gene 113